MHEQIAHEFISHRRGSPGNIFPQSHLRIQSFIHTDVYTVLRHQITIVKSHLSHLIPQILSQHCVPSQWPSICAQCPSNICTKLIDIAWTGGRGFPAGHRSVSHVEALTALRWMDSCAWAGYQFHLFSYLCS